MSDSSQRGAGGDALPELRASDAEREQAAEVLRIAASEGRLNVEEVSNFALMGGDDVKPGDEVIPAGGPTIHIRLVSIMGGSSVKRGRKLSRSERRELRKAERRELGSD